MCKSVKCRKFKRTTNMSEAKTPNSTDIEKQDNEKNIESEENNEPLEKAKEKPPPRINAALVLFYAIFFCMFAIGWVNLNNCRLSRLVPIYLIVTGFLGGAIKFISKTTNKHLFNLTIVLVLLYFMWQGLGTYWVYKEYQPNYENSTDRRYCDRTTYLLSFWILTLQYTVVGFIILLTSCQLLMKGDFRKK